MQADWTLVTGPTQEPISLAEAKQECRVDTDDENSRMYGYIRASRMDAEMYLNRGFYTQTWKLVQDDWSESIWLPMAAPLQSVTTVQYYNSAGTLTTATSSDYVVDTTTEPGRIVRAPNVTWPTLQADRHGAVIVTYIVGWTSVALIPEQIKQGIAVLVQWRHERMADPEKFKAALRCLDFAGRVSWRAPVYAYD